MMSLTLIIVPISEGFPLRKLVCGTVGTSEEILNISKGFQIYEIIVVFRVTVVFNTYSRFITKRKCCSLIMSTFCVLWIF